MQVLDDLTETKLLKENQEEHDDKYGPGFMSHYVGLTYNSPAMCHSQEAVLNGF